MDLLIFTTIVVKITNPKSGLNLITNSSSPVLSAPSYYFTGARRYPLSYVYSGYYGWDSGRTGNQNEGGHWWSSKAENSSKSYLFHTSNTALYSQTDHLKDQGFTLR
ncbi:hypothetical protein IK112_02530 [Candidatus Saccharibacteria bacterium]|nr:hypothetical protein [Candidatus Saccharibacteria bacterium]